MLMHGTRHPHRLRIIRGNHRRRQPAAGTPDILKHMVHLGICLATLPCLALNGDRIHCVGCAQLIPRGQTGEGVTPFARTGEIQGRTVPTRLQHMHHILHRAPLVNTDKRHLAPIGRSEQTKLLLHTHAAMRGGNQHTRTADPSAAGSGEHHIRGRQEDERIDILLIEGMA